MYLFPVQAEDMSDTGIPYNGNQHFKLLVLVGPGNCFCAKRQLYYEGPQKNR